MIAKLQVFQFLLAIHELTFFLEKKRKKKEKEERKNTNSKIAYDPVPVPLPLHQFYGN